MRIFSLVIVLFLFSVQSSFANATTDMEKFSAVAASKSSFTPELLQKVEKLVSDRGFLRAEVWRATEYGFQFNYKKTDKFPVCGILLTWDGDVIQRCPSSSWSRVYDDTILLNWNDIKQ